MPCFVGDDTRSISGRILDSEVRTTVFTPDQPLLPGNYRAWVRAFNGTTPVTGWSPASRFTVTESDGPPTVTAPLYQTTSTVPNITWTAVTGAASYAVEIFDADPTVFTVQPVVSASGIQTTAHRPGSTLSPGNYYVRVRSHDAGGTPSAWSDVQFFSVQPTVTASLVYPVARSSVSGTELFFAWTAVQNAARYELWVNHLDSNTVQIYNETALTSLSFTPAGTVFSGRYRAWIRAVDSAGQAGAWRPGLDFRTP